MHKSWLALFLPVALSISLMAQDPTGTVAGVITDESGGLVPDATVKITNKETGAVRIVKSGFDGSFSAPSLPAGYYEVSAEAAGFRILVRPAQVETGATTTVNITMQVGVAKEVLTIEAAPANINYETN